MRVFLEIAGAPDVAKAMQALDDAQIMHSGGATVTEDGREYGVILVDSPVAAREAVRVLLRAGFTARLDGHPST